MTKHYIKMAYPKTQMAEYRCDDGLVAAARRIGGEGRGGWSTWGQRDQSMWDESGARAV
jgi:hypothetical protein